MKDWLIEYGLKKFGPSAARGAVLAGAGLIAAHAELLAKFGVVYDQATNAITIHLDGLSAGLLVLATAAMAGAIKVTQHQTAALLPKAPAQPGDTQSNG